MQIFRKLPTPYSPEPRMPTTTASYSGAWLKSGVTTRHYSDETAFYTNMAQNRPSRGGYQAIMNSSTARQTIVNLASGARGVLTAVVGAAMPALGASSVIVTADGVEYEYDYEALSVGTKPILGGFVVGAPITGSAGVHVLQAGSYSDSGFSSGQITILNPAQALAAGIGIPFKNSLKVEQILEFGAHITSRRHRAAVAYAKY